MGRQQAGRVAERIHLDRVVRLRRLDNNGDWVADAQLWAAREVRSGVHIGREGSIQLEDTAYIIRYDARFAALRIVIDDGDRTGLSVVDIEEIGRGRFLRLVVQ